MTSRIIKLIGISLTLAFTAPLYAQSPSAVVAPLQFTGDVNRAMRTSLNLKLKDGLNASAIDIVDDLELNSSLNSACDEPSCWRKVCERKKATYIIGGTIHGEARSYDIELWLADGKTAKQIAEIKDRCDICGQAALNERIGLAASSLAAKLEEHRKRPAHIQVNTATPDATLSVNGEPKGSAPQNLELPAGDYTFECRAPGHIAGKRRVVVVEGMEEKINFDLIPIRAEKTNVGKIIGWTTLGVGLGAIGAGVALHLINGQTRGCPTDPPGAGVECREVRDTTITAWAVTGAGIGTTLIGTFLLYYFWQTPDSTPKTATLSRSLSLISVGDAGLGLKGLF